MERIYHSLELVSKPLREVLVMVKTTCDSFVSDSGLTMVNSIVFLRFLCPSLIDPRKFGLLPVDLEPIVRRNLILVLKVVQNIASGVEFDGSKEEYMTCLNALVDRHHPLLCGKVQQLLSANQLRNRKDSKKSHLPPLTEQEALITLINLYCENQNQLYERVESPFAKQELGMIFPDLFSEDEGLDGLAALPRVISLSRTQIP